MLADNPEVYFGQTRNNVKKNYQSTTMLHEGLWSKNLSDEVSFGGKYESLKNASAFNGKSATVKGMLFLKHNNQHSKDGTFANLR